MSSQFQSLWRVWSSGTPHIPHIWVMLLCVLTLIGCGAAVDGQRGGATALAGSADRALSLDYP